MAKRVFVAIGLGCLVVVGGFYVLNVGSSDARGLASAPQPASVEVADSAGKEALDVQHVLSSLRLDGRETNDGAGPETSPGEVTSFVWREPSLTAVPDQIQAEHIIGRGRAELLAPFLEPDWQERLSNQLAEIDDTIRATAQVYDALVVEAKTQLLAARPDRVIRIPQGLPKDAPERAVLLEARATVDGPIGAVWADVDPMTGEEKHYLFFWEEWPDIREMLGQMGELTSARREIARVWITEQWGVSGHALLVSK